MLCKTCHSLEAAYEQDSDPRVAAGALLVNRAMAQNDRRRWEELHEQQIMSQMTAQLLQAKGFKPDVKAGMGSGVVRQAQENGQIDVYWEYTGTWLITYNRITPGRLGATPTTKVKLDAAKGLVWLNRCKANNTYSLAMNADDAKKQGIVSISDSPQGEGRREAHVREATPSSMRVSTG